MDSEDGEVFIKQLAGFVRTHEKALANAAQHQRRDVRHRPSQSATSVNTPSSPTLPERPSTSASSSTSAVTLSMGSGLASRDVKSAKLALTPHHLFYLLSRFEELGIAVGPMKVRLENLHDSTASSNYVSFLSNAQRLSRRGSDVASINSVSSVRSVMSGMSALLASFGLGASISAARTERQKAALQADMKYLYSAFTKLPCLRLAPDWRARLISGYEEFPFDSAVPLYAFKNLQTLEISSIDFRQFFGWDRLADQLRSLSLKRAGIEDPADILIDIVLDDMDKRRRRTSKSQPSPSATWIASGSPRRSPTLSHPEYERSVSMADSPGPRSSLVELHQGPATPNDTAIEDGQASYRVSRPHLAREDTEEVPLSPRQRARSKSNSPSRPQGSRARVSYTRSAQRITRSGSSSSHSSLSDSWHHQHRGSTGNLLAGAYLPSSKWRFLRHLSLADNSMTSIPPTSLSPLSNTLYSLDLSSNLFSQVPDSLASLTALRALNLSHCMIDSLHSLKRNPLPAITALNLRANRLQSLAGVERLYPLERLDLRDNRLADPMEIARLTGIPEIREIWLEGNPFSRTHRDYRVTVFNLFRKTPGYTEDVVIDGTGPSYSERRQLVERVPIPESVPVVKPTPPEIPAVDVSKPTIIYAGSDGSPVERKERPVPKAVMSEVNTTSSRRRKTPKRRIVDLATGSTPPSPAPVEVLDPRKSSTGVASSTFVLEGGFRGNSFQGAAALLPPVVLTDTRTTGAATDSSRMDPRVIPELSPIFTAGASSKNWISQQDWDTSGETYRRKIEALRDSVGSSYLSALDENAWATSNAFASTGLPPTAAIRTGQAPQQMAPIALTSGRTLG